MLKIKGAFGLDLSFEKVEIFNLVFVKGKLFVREKNVE